MNLKGKLHFDLYYFTGRGLSCNQQGFKISFKGHEKKQQLHFCIEDIQWGFPLGHKSGFVKYQNEWNQTQDQYLLTVSYTVDGAKYDIFFAGYRQKWVLHEN